MNSLKVVLMIVMGTGLILACEMVSNWVRRRRRPAPPKPGTAPADPAESAPPAETEPSPAPETVSEPVAPAKPLMSEADVAAWRCVTHEVEHLNRLCAQLAGLCYRTLEHLPENYRDFETLDRLATDIRRVLGHDATTFCTLARAEAERQVARHIH
jgi:hypothetical protein